MMHSQSSDSRSGFSLIELIVAVAIMVVMVGAAVPVTSKVLTYKARKATRDELQYLSDAAGEFYKDTRRLPADIEELIVNPSYPGWSGPYLPGVVTDQISGLVGYQVDAWSRPYEVSSTGSTLTISSAGEDGNSGSAVDIALDLDVTYIQRAATLDQLETINRAVALYNDEFMASAPLSTSWNSALGQLVTAGFLPTSEGYEQDWWDAGFVADPPGASPVVRIKSPTLDPSGGGSGAGAKGGSSGKKKAKKKNNKKSKKKKKK